MFVNKLPISSISPFKNIFLICKTIRDESWDVTAASPSDALKRPPGGTYLWCGWSGLYHHIIITKWRCNWPQTKHKTQANCSACNQMPTRRFRAIHLIFCC